MKKALLTAFAAVVLSTAAVFAEVSPSPDPPTVCKKGSEAELRVTAGKHNAKFLKETNAEAVRLFTVALVEKLSAPEIVTTAAYYVLTTIDGNPLTGIYLFDKDGCYIAGANMPSQIVRALLVSISKAGA